MVGFWSGYATDSDVFEQIKLSNLNNLQIGQCALSDRGAEDAPTISGISGGSLKL
jgi:hypothetical protein